MPDASPETEARSVLGAPMSALLHARLTGRDERGSYHWFEDQMGK